MHTNVIPVFVLGHNLHQDGCSLAERAVQMEEKPKLALHCYVLNHFSQFPLLLGLASSYEPLKRGGERPGTE